MRTDRIANLLIGSIILTFGIIFLTYYQVQNNRESRRAVNHSYDVIHQVTSYLSTIKDAETGQRGYLITRDTAFLKPYLEAEKDLPQKLQRLQKLVSKYPLQLAAVKRLGTLTQLKIKNLSDGIQKLHRQGIESAFASRHQLEGKIAMDSLRFYAGKLVQQEHVLLEQRYYNLEKLYGSVDFTRYGSLLIVIVISILALVSMNRKHKQNKSLLHRLRQFNKHLGDLITSRTHLLEEKNKVADVLNEELQQNIEEMKTLHETNRVQNKKTEDALTEVSDLYNYSPCGYHSSDHEGMIIRMNATELSWLGYSADEILGKKKFRDLLSANTLDQWHLSNSEFLAKGHISDVELELVRKDGTLLPVSVSSSVQADADRKFIMTRSVVFDLTERKKMDLKLKDANDRLILANAEKNNFLGMASHDLKSPLNAILGLIHLLRIDADNLTQDQKENINFIFESGRNMKAMIDRLLDLNRIEQGKSIVQKAPLEVIALMKKIIAASQVVSAKKNISLVFENHPPVIDMDSDSQIITQILENLISNAVKFSPPDKKVWIGALVDDEKLIIKIKDEGPGIKPTEVHKLFGKFQKLSARPTGGETSTGLGLSIVKELVSSLDGVITFQVAPGPGATFVLTLPLT